MSEESELKALKDRVRTYMQKIMEQGSPAHREETRKAIEELEKLEEELWEIVERGER